MKPERLTKYALRKQLALIGVRKDTVAARAVKELIEYKDIEEELGTDLVTLFKALKDGIYAVVPDYDGPTIEFFESYKLRLDMYSKRIDIHDDDLACVLIIAYKKTWALEKRQLEEELK